MNKIKTINSKGITLIALVITIIVLLILAGISIAMLTGENGILTQAQNAKNRTEEATANEIADLEELNKYINNQTKEEDDDEEIKVEDENPGELDGEGTEANPFKIRSIEDLVMFSKMINEGNNFSGKFIELMCTLNFNSDNSYVDADKVFVEYGASGDINGDGVCENIKKELTTGKGFISIGNENCSLKGDFNGNSNIIKNLYIDVDENQTENVESVGLFAYNRGKIKNLSVTGNIKVNNENTEYVGGIVGLNSNSGIFDDGGYIINCKNSCNIEVNNTYTYIYIGGIAGSDGESTGSSLTYGKIETSCNNGNITINNKNDAIYAGGVAGSVTYQSSMSNCYNIGNILMEGEETAGCNIGGITGTASQCEIKNTFNVGKVYINTGIGQKRVGGIEGDSTSAELNNCYNIGDIEFNELDTIGWDSYVGGIAR